MWAQPIISGLEIRVGEDLELGLTFAAQGWAEGKPAPVTSLQRFLYAPAQDLTQTQMPLGLLGTRALLWEASIPVIRTARKRVDKEAEWVTHLRAAVFREGSRKRESREERRSHSTQKREATAR